MTINANSNALAVRQESGIDIYSSFDNLLKWGSMVIDSELFGTRFEKPQQVAMVVLAGRDMGMSPMEALTELFATQGGSLGMTTKAMVSRFNRAGHQLWIVQKTDQISVIGYKLADGREGEVVMTMKEAQQAKWNQIYDRGEKRWKPKHTWTAMPAIMLQWRNISNNIIRPLCPEVIWNLPTDDEAMDETVRIEERASESGGHLLSDEEYAEWLAYKRTSSGDADTTDAEFEEVLDGVEGDEGESGYEDDAPPAPENGKGMTRPLSPETVKAFILKIALENGNTAPPSKAKRGAVVGVLEALFPNDSKDISRAKRYGLLRFFFGTDTSNELTEAQCDALSRWAQDYVDGQYATNPHAIHEAAAIIEMLDAAQGQQRLV